MRCEDVWAMVGKTPHLRMPCPDLAVGDLFVKMEGTNPTGSVKDRACVKLLQENLQAGSLSPGRTLIDASSGNMGCAIAYFGRLLGHPVKIISSSKLTDDKRGFMCYYGAQLDTMGEFTIEGSRACRDIAAAAPDRYCFLDQLHSWANPRAHYETTGPEILSDFPDVAMVVGSLGTGGTLLGTAQFLKEKRPGVVVVAVQSAVGTRLPGTGSFDEGDYITPFIQLGYDRYFDHVARIEFAQAAARTLALRDRGLFVGIQTGGVVQAAVCTAQQLGIDGTIVAISGDSGWKNMEKLRAL